MPAPYTSIADPIVSVTELALVEAASVRPSLSRILVNTDDASFSEDAVLIVVSLIDEMDEETVIMVVGALESEVS